MPALQYTQWGELEGWLRQHGSNAPLAVILGGSVNGLSFVRSLGRRRVPTLLLDSERLIGVYTRYGKVVLLPPVEDQPQAWLDLLDLVGACRRGPGVLFPTSDTHCLFVSERRDTLRRHFKFLVADAPAMEQLLNKRLQYGVAAAAGIPIPRSYAPQSAEELRCLAADLPYPCLLKPYQSHVGRKRLGKKVVVVGSQAELLSAYARLTLDGIPLLVQEIIPGGDSALFGYLAFWDANGREVAWVTKRKLRQYPPLYGDGSLQITTEAPEVADLSRRLLRALNYRGFVGVEFKLDSRDHSYRLIEVNPRTVSGNELAIRAGVDFPWIGYRYLTCGELDGPPAAPFQLGVKCVNEEWDIQAYWALRGSGTLSLWRWLRSLHGAKAAIGAWDDPAPLVVGLWRFLQVLCRALWSTVRRKRDRSPAS